MITVYDLQQLVDSWTHRMNNPIQPTAYKDALFECIYELNQLIDKTISEELTYQDILEQEADSYLSSMEAHENVA